MAEPGSRLPLPVYLVGGPAADPSATPVGAAPAPFTATVSTKIFDANPNASLRTFQNDSDQTLHLRFHASVATVAAPGANTGYHVKVPPGAYFSTDLKCEVRGLMGAAIVTGWVSVSEFA